TSRCSASTGKCSRLRRSRSWSRRAHRSAGPSGSRRLCSPSAQASPSRGCYGTRHTPSGRHRSPSSSRGCSSIRSSSPTPSVHLRGRSWSGPLSAHLAWACSEAAPQAERPHPRLLPGARLDEVERALPGCIGCCLELLLLAVEEAVGRALELDQLVVLAGLA